MKRTISITVCTLATTLPLTAQTPAPAPSAGSARETAEKAHLVGHEDAILLKRIEDAIAEWDPRNLTSPYLRETNTAGGKKLMLRRPDLADFIADPDAAVQLGKALFWEMQAGSDYGKKSPADQKIYGTACASCHYRFGADARDRNTEAVSFQAWRVFASDRGLTPVPADNANPFARTETAPFTQRSVPFTANETITANKFTAPGSGLLQHEIVGSQGVTLRRFTGIDANGLETFADVPRPAGFRRRADMFADGAISPNGANRTRQVTQRNSPSVINAVFNDRQFHDGRAESTFNGFSIFGDYDKRVVLKKAILGGDGKALRYEPVGIAIVNASLAAQAVGPAVNEVEMSWLGRNFHDIGIRLLPAQPLATQTVSTTDSVLGKLARNGATGLFSEGGGPALNYRQLIQRAFRKEWWAEEGRLSAQPAFTARLAAAKVRVTALNNALPAAHTALRTSVAAVLNGNARFPADAAVKAISPKATAAAVIPLYNAAKDWQDIESEILPLRRDSPVDRTAVNEALAIRTAGGPNGLTAQDDLMVNNFSLYWGLSIMLYESTLISNDSAFDQMMRGDDKGVNAVWSGQTGQSMAAVAGANGNTAVPPEPPGDDTIRRVQLDKLTTLNAPPVLTGTAMFQRGFRVFVKNCAECHEPPFFTSAANMELEPEVPEPIAKLHAHSLVRTALADAFKVRLADSGNPPPKGVDNSNRRHLGARRWFFDQERIPALEDLLGPIMVENMGVPDQRPVSLTALATLPGAPAPDRNPMITWTGTRPPLGFAPSPKPKTDPQEPYAFYDTGFYNVGVAEPRYDWGIWGFAGFEDLLSVAKVRRFLLIRNLVPDLEIKRFTGLPRGSADKTLRLPDDAALQKNGISRKAVENLLELAENADKARIEAKLPVVAPEDEATLIPEEITGLPDLGSAYRMPSRKRATLPGSGGPEDEVYLRYLRSPALNLSPFATVAVDHSAERNYLGLPAAPGTPAGTPGDQGRHSVHFFKRARRMVMTDESWGHRKSFINDNELMGWGAFKAPGLRNVALTQPYMHNGRFLTLRQVLRFYSFDNPALIPAHPVLNPDLHPEMGRLPLNADGLVAGATTGPGAAIRLEQIQDAESLLFFMHCLTDPRVLKEAAPFDHPEIRLPNGYAAGNPAVDNVFTVPATGASGGAPPAQFPSGS